MGLVKIVFNPWVAGSSLAGVRAAVMSTLSAQLLVSSSALTQDFYKAMLRKNASQTELVWVGRGMVLLIALIAIGIASNPDSKVLGLVSYAWAGFGAAFGPVVLIAGLITIAPLIGDIPGVPTLLGLVVVLTLGQLFFQPQSGWIPNKLSNRRTARENLINALDWLQ